MTRIEIELALDQGRLRANVRGAKSPWVVRRNGRTKVWKTRPADFVIPVTVGFRTYGHITAANASDPMWLVD